MSVHNDKFADEIGHLVLNRRVDEDIIVNDDFVIKVLGWDNASVRLSFVAPKKGYTIYRREIWEKIKAGVEKPC